MPPSDFSVLRSFIEKRIPENHMQIWLWNSSLDFIANKMRPLNSPDWNPPDYYVKENIWGQSQLPSETEDIAKLKEMLQMTV